jgi:hypothetical protein
MADNWFRQRFIDPRMNHGRSRAEKIAVRRLQGWKIYGGIDLF